MVNPSVYPDNYLTYNSQQTKKPVVVVRIPGLDLLSSTALYSRIRYGDAGLIYGLPGIVYGGLRRRTDFRDLISLDGSSMTIGQKVEPEQGRAAVSLMSLAFIDKDGYMSQAIARGVLIDEILGKPVRIYFGYQDTSYPEDYFTIFRGYITGVTAPPGMVTFQISDASLKRRQNIFLGGKTGLTTPITNGAPQVINVASTAGLYVPILGPDNTYDSGVKTYVKIDSEWMQYGPGDILNSTQVNIPSRGQRGTAGATHTSGSAVETGIEITGEAVQLALKIMLSGWAGPYVSGVSIRSIRSTLDTGLGDQPTAFVLDYSIDAVNDLGVTVGDYFAITDTAIPANALSGQILAIGPWGDLPNRVIYTNQTFPTVQPDAGNSTTWFRSQFDTLPVLAGLKLQAYDVDVQTHIDINNDFLSQDIYQFFRTTEEAGKSFLESQIFLPEGCYPVTRFGKISLNLNRPPIANQRLQVVDSDSVLNPDQITFQRNLNSRRFYNAVQYDYDPDDGGTFLSSFQALDSDSASTIGVISQIKIEAQGLRQSLSGNLIANRRSLFLLSRYKNAAYEIPIKLSWTVGSLIETGDVIALQDEGGLQIVNLSDGKRDLGTQLFEVIDRRVDIKSGEVSLQLLSSPGFDQTDRYATISPSSLVAAGSTSSSLILQNSFGNVFLGKEQNKWTDYIGQDIVVHDYGWTQESQTTIVGFDSVNDHLMHVSPPLSFTPAAGYVVDIAPYPDTTNPKDAAIYKAIHAFLDPTLTVVSGISATQFTVSAPDALKLQVGLPILIHNASYSILSPDSKVLSVVGTTVTVATALGFTPSAGQSIEIVGFKDAMGGYRIL